MPSILIHAQKGKEVDLRSICPPWLLSKVRTTLAWDPNLEREVIQEASGITSLSDLGHGTMRELPWPHESTRFLTWSCALAVFHNQILCHFTSESLLRNKTSPVHFYVMIITGKVFRNHGMGSLPVEW